MKGGKDEERNGGSGGGKGSEWLCYQFLALDTANSEVKGQWGRAVVEGKVILFCRNVVLALVGTRNAMKCSAQWWPWSRKEVWDVFEDLRNHTNYCH